jgi:MFS family permease
MLFALVYLLANGALALQGTALLYLRVQSGGLGGLAFGWYFASVVSAVALLVYPLIGALSDRTTSPLLRRRLYLLLGTVLFAAAPVALLVAQSLLQFLLAWVLLQVGSAAIQLMLLAALPDMTPLRQRGILAALIAAGTALGGVAGGLLLNQLLTTARAADATSTNLVPIVAALAGSTLVSAALAALVLRSPPIPPDTPASHAPYTDFGWAALSRAYLAIAGALLGTYAFIVVGRVDLQLVSYSETAAIVVAALATGFLSDRAGRRKPFVLTGALLTAAGIFLWILMALSPGSWMQPQTLAGLAILGGALLGAGSGAYLTTQLALATQVLPAPRHYARDLGWMQLAGLLPSAVLPFVNLYFLFVPGSPAYPQVNYVAMLGIAAVCAVLGGLAILRVRTSR